MLCQHCLFCCTLVEGNLATATWELDQLNVWLQLAVRAFDARFYIECQFNNINDFLIINMLCNKYEDPERHFTCNYTLLCNRTTISGTAFPNKLNYFDWDVYIFPKIDIMRGDSYTFIINITKLSC